VRGPDVAADDVGRAAELVLPQRRADQDDPIVSRDLVAGTE